MRWDIIIKLSITYNYTYTHEDLLRHLVKRRWHGECLKESAIKNKYSKTFCTYTVIYNFRADLWTISLFRYIWFVTKRHLDSSIIFFFVLDECNRTRSQTSYMIDFLGMNLLLISCVRTSSGSIWQAPPAALLFSFGLDGARPNLHFPSVIGGVPFEIVNYGLARKARVYTRANLTKW